MRGREAVQKFEVLFYDKEDGTEPAKEFIQSLDVKMRVKVMKTVELLQNNGTELRKPYSEHLEDGIFELRVKIGSDISRVLYFFVVGRRAILTNGFIKKQQKTPANEIERAKRYRAEFLSRKERKQ